MVLWGILDVDLVVGTSGAHRTGLKVYWCLSSRSTSIRPHWYRVTSLNLNTTKIMSAFQNKNLFRYFGEKDFKSLGCHVYPRV